MNSTNDSQPEAPDWAECPQGEIGGLVGRLRTQRRQNSVRALSVAGGAAALIIAVGLVVMNRPADVPGGQGILAGEIWCSDFMDWSEEYISGQLDAVRNRQMNEHLAQCEHCQQKLQEMRAMQDSELPPTPTEAGLQAGRQETLTAQHQQTRAVTLVSR